MYILVVIITNTSFPYWKGLKECLLMGHSCSHICMPQDSVCHKSFSVHSLVVIANVLKFLHIIVHTNYVLHIKLFSQCVLFA